MENKNDGIGTKIGEILLYSVPEISDVLNVTTVTVRNYLHQGDLEGQKVMGRWFVRAEEVHKKFPDYFKDVPQ